MSRLQIDLALRLAVLGPFKLFLRGYLKSKEYVSKSRATNELWTNICAENIAMPLELFKKVLENAVCLIF